LFQVMGLFAEFERAMIKERVMSGLERSRQMPNATSSPAANSE
jgi:DNA invertase Pin-like site-specific DNA recombinase